MKKLIQRRAFWGVVFLVALVLGNGWSAYRNANYINLSQRWVAHTYLVLNKLERVITQVKEVESGQRGYVLTGEEKYRNEYSVAHTALFQEIRLLKSLTVDNTLQQERLNKLEDSVRKVVEDADKVISAASFQSRVEAERLLKGVRQEEKIDQVFLLVSELKKEEEQLLRTRADEFRKNFQYSVDSFLISTLIGLTFIGITYFLVVRDLREREKTTEIIAGQRDWFNTTLSSIGDAVIVTDSKGIIMFMNSVAEEMTGWQSEEATGQPLTNVFTIIDEETRQKVDNPIGEALKEGRKHDVRSNNLLISRSGKEYPIDDCASPIKRKGTLEGMVVVFHDVTNSRRYEQELREYTRELQESHKRKDEFLAMLAHELRGPLAPIKNALHVLQLSPSDPRLSEEVRKVMNRQVDHLSKIIDDLLDVSRITRGMVTLREERIDLCSVVRTAVEDRRTNFEQVEIALTVELPNTPVWVRGDSTRLTQVIDNLLSNANKFTGKGGTVFVTLREGSEEGKAQIIVKDSGIGFDPEMQGKMFEVFTQADKSLDRTRGGLGLGLSVVKGLVELHHGTVEARSEGAGKGAEFIVTLPREEEPPALLTISESVAPATKKLRILVVEDNQDAAESLRLLLELTGYEVSVARSGSEGLSLARQFRPNVVLCDIGLPGMSGFEVAAALRENDETANARLIAVTGYGQEEDKRKVFEAGFDNHLVKPVDPAILIRSLSTSKN